MHNPNDHDLRITRTETKRNPLRASARCANINDILISNKQASSPGEIIPGGAVAVPDREADPRICMPSWRNFRKVAYQGGLYEAQDVLCEIDDVDLICLDPGKGFRVRENLQRKLLWRDSTKKLAFLNPGLRPIRLKRRYDIFIAICQNWWDLLCLNAIKGWKEQCGITVCWIDEMWAAWVPRYKNWLHVLNRFDHVFLNLHGSVHAVEEALGRRCHWLPAGVDTVRFSPYPDPPARIIDFYSIGRKWEGVHRALLDQVKRNRILYIYDTGNVNEMFLPDHKQHRDLISNIAKRSRFFMVAPAKMDIPFDTKGQIEVGSRYFEGAAAGSVLIGKKAECESFDKLFGWQDSVIEIETDGSDLVDVLSDLARQPQRLRDMSQRNCIQTLLRHDWGYRWKEILHVAGLQPKPAMEAREKRLTHMAQMAGFKDHP